MHTKNHANSLFCLVLFMFNILRQRQNRSQFSDDNFKCIFLNENISISIKISLMFVPRGPVDNIPALSETMIVSLLTHIWVRSQRCGCLVTWFCYQLIAKPGNKIAAPSRPDPYTSLGLNELKLRLDLCNLFTHINLDFTCSHKMVPVPMK